MKNIFNPKSVALIGASEEKNTVGLGISKNLLEGSQERKVFFVNPNRDIVLGLNCFSKITDIQDKIDLAVIAIPAKFVKEAVLSCVEKKVKGIIIISGGFKEEGNEKEEEEIREIVRKNKIPLIGPNCLGIINPCANLNASFAPITPKKGSIAFLSQSGALIDSVIDMAENIGFSKIVSYGNESDLELVDFLNYFKDDKETKVISIYVEGLKDGRKFMEVAKGISKPIVLIKAGRSDKGIRAAESHTGSLAGDYSVYKSAMKQSGVILVETIEELLDTSKALAWQPRCEDGIGIVTNGGGLGVLTADYCFQLGIDLPELEKGTVSFLDKKLKKVVNKSNPLDVIGDAMPERYEAAIEAMLLQKNIKGLIIISTPQIMTDHDKNAKIIVRLKKKYPTKPIMCCFVGGKLVSSAVKHLEENNIPNYFEPMRAVKSIKSLMKHG